ncbi:putative gustatory receptor 28b [Cephus cinctus]|uniref:Gustatory receptor n=1 Tax=Cephus cinctus TaxID=211228 RepID=A0AAJ7VY42_CEPCN|nr:putative gustatory receptor 28b [Cephus cinctus]
MTNIKLTIAFIMIDIILHAVTSYLFLFNLNLLEAVAVASFFNYPFQISLALDLVFITNNGLISTRLKKMNIFMEDTIKTVMEPVNTWKFNSQTDSRVTKIKIINSDLIRLKFISSAVQAIRQAHQELCDIARELNEQLSVQVTVEMAGCFGLFTGLLYNLYVTLVSHHDSIIAKVNSVVSLSLWSLVYIGKVFFINRSCAIAVVEAKKIGEIIHELDSPIINDELRNEVHQFALQMVQNPLIFTGCGFFSLNYSFVQSFVGSVTTYLVILIQMSKIPSKPDVPTELSTIYENSTEWW